MENIISSLLNIKGLMEDILQRFNVIQQHLQDFRESHNKINQVFQQSLDDFASNFQESFNQVEDQICAKQEEDAAAVEEKDAIKPVQLTFSHVPKYPEPFPSFSDPSLRTSCPLLHFGNYFFSSSFLSVATSNNYSIVRREALAIRWEFDPGGIYFQCINTPNRSQFKDKKGISPNKQHLVFNVNGKITLTPCAQLGISFWSKLGALPTFVLVNRGDGFFTLRVNLRCEVLGISQSWNTALLRLQLPISRSDFQIMEFDPGGSNFHCLHSEIFLQTINLSTQTMLPHPRQSHSVRVDKAILSASQSPSSTSSTTLLGQSGSYRALHAGNIDDWNCLLLCILNVCNDVLGCLPKIIGVDVVEMALWAKKNTFSVGIQRNLYDGLVAATATESNLKGTSHHETADTNAFSWSHFSTVWLAWDTHFSQYVALKVQKSAQHYSEAAMDEVTILKQIAEGDLDDKKCIVKLLDNFKHLGPNGQHVCVVFEYLGDNLLTLIKCANYRGMPIHRVKDMWGYTSMGDAVRLRNGNQKLARGNVASELFDERHEGTLAYESKLNRMKIKTDIPVASLPWKGVVNLEIDPAILAPLPQPVQHVVFAFALGYPRRDQLLLFLKGGSEHGIKRTCVHILTTDHDVWNCKNYKVFLGGTIIERPTAVGGSGSSYLCGFFDQAWMEGMAPQLCNEIPEKNLMMIFQLFGPMFINLISRIRASLETGTGLFFPMIVLRVLENVVQPNFLQKMIVLQFFKKLCVDSQILVGVITLWKAKFEETIFQEKDPAPSVDDHSIKNWNEFASASEGNGKVQIDQVEEIALKLDLDGLHVMGGDGSHTNTYLLAANFRGKNLITQPLFVPFDRGKGLLDEWPLCYHPLSQLVF